MYVHRPLLTDENKSDGVRRERGPSRGRGGASGSGAGRGRGEAASRDRRKETDRLTCFSVFLWINKCKDVS